MASQLPGVAVGGLVSLVVAVVLLFVQRYLRERGGLNPEITWTQGGHSMGESVRREFEVKFFNARDVDVALWDIRLEFYKEGRRTASLEPNFAGTPGPVRVLNLPSRVAIVREMGVEIKRDTLEAVRQEVLPLIEADKAVFRGVIPGGEEIREDLKGEPPPWPA